MFGCVCVRGGVDGCVLVVVVVVVVVAIVLGGGGVDGW